MLRQVFLLICFGALAAAQSSKTQSLTPHSEHLTDDEADKIADEILSDLDGESTAKLFNVLRVPDPEVIPDNPGLYITYINRIHN